jgi:spore coat protein U-like protein
MKRTVLFLIALMVLVFSVSAFAATKTTTFPVTANVISNCTISVSAGGVAFGAYDPVSVNSATGVNATGTATVTVNCTKGDLGVWVGLDNGSNYLVPNRRMISGANFLNYGLYQDAAFTTAWGNTAATAPAAFPAFASASTPQTLTVYGQLPRGQDATVGAYSDTVTATVNY